MTTRHCLARDERGGALVEFAIVLPLLLVLVFGIVDFARAFALLNNLTSAAREGARYASTRPSPGTSTTLIQNRTTSYISSFGGASCTGTCRVNVTFTPNATSPDQITVSIVNYPFTMLTPLPSFIGARIGTMPAITAVFRSESTGG